MKFSKGDKVVTDPKSWSHASWKDYVFTVLDYYEVEQQYAVETPAGFRKLFKAKDLVRLNAEVPKFGIGDVVRTKDVFLDTKEFVVSSVYSTGTDHSYQGSGTGLFHEDNLVLSLKATEMSFRVGDFVRVTGGARAGQVAEVMQDGATMLTGTYLIRFINDGNRAMFGKGLLEALSTNLAVGDRAVLVKGPCAGKEGVLSVVGSSTVMLDHDGGFVVTTAYHRNVRRISRFSKGDKVQPTQGYWKGSEWTVTGQHGPDHVTAKTNMRTAVLPVAELEKVKPTVVSGSISSLTFDESNIVTGKINISPTMPKTDADSDTLKKIQTELETANMLAYLAILENAHTHGKVTGNSLQTLHDLRADVESRMTK